MRFYTILTVTLVICLLLLSGCASRYHPISPETLNYSASVEEGGVDFSYRYGVLRERDNKKLAKKEDKRNIRLVAVKIVNNTNEVMVIGQNYNFYTGSSMVSLLSPELIQSSIKQNTLTYLPYLLLTALTLNVTKTDEFGSQSSSTYPVGLIIGPGITIGNMIVAGKANKRFEEDLRQYSLLNQHIEIGETKYGLIGLDASSYDPLILRKNNKGE